AAKARRTLKSISSGPRVAGIVIGHRRRGAQQGAESNSGRDQTGTDGGADAVALGVQDALLFAWGRADDGFAGSLDCRRTIGTEALDGPQRAFWDTWPRRFRRP